MVPNGDESKDWNEVDELVRLWRIIGDDIVCFLGSCDHDFESLDLAVLWRL